MDKNPDEILVIKKFPNHAKILICDDKEVLRSHYEFLGAELRARRLAQAQTLAAEYWEKYVVPVQK